MKIIKTASGKSIVKLSKKEWLNIGRTAGWIKKKAQAEESMPREVKEVHDLAVHNAREADMPDDAVYTRYDLEYNEWIIGDNYERLGGSMVFRDGEWFWRNQWDGEDSPMRGGSREAKSTASMMYTG